MDPSILYAILIGLFILTAFLLIVGRTLKSKQQSFERKKAKLQAAAAAAAEAAPQEQDIDTPSFIPSSHASRERRYG